MSRNATRCTWMIAGLLLGAVAPAQSTDATRPNGYTLPDGTIRIVGAASTQHVVEKLNALYIETHPNVRFQFKPADNNGAIDALIFDASPFAALGTVYGGGIAYSDIVKAPPFSIRIAHGSLSPEAQVSPLAVIVNPANPLDQMKFADLASMFSKPLRARVFAQWSQAGVGGPQGRLAIQPAGLPWSDHYASEDRPFADDVFFRRFAGAAPVDNYRMFKTYAEVVAFVAHEPGAIGIVELNKLTPAVAASVKVVGLVDGAFGKPRRGSAEDIESGHYPLDRFLYINARALTGKPLDPLVQQYLMLVLSPEGQAAIASEGEGYLPLNVLELAEERSKFQ